MSTPTDGDDVSSWGSDDLENFLQNNHVSTASSSNTALTVDTSTRPTVSTQINTDEDISSWNSDELADFLSKDRPQPTDKSQKHRKKKKKKSNKSQKHKTKKKKKSSKHQPKTIVETLTPRDDASKKTKHQQRSPSSESMASYDIVHPTIKYNLSKRACAKMLVRAGYRCGCHFKLRTECPFDHRYKPSNDL